MTLALLVGIAFAGPVMAKEVAQDLATAREIERAVSDRSPPSSDVAATMKWLELHPAWLSRLGAQIAPLPLSRTWTAHVALATAWIDFAIVTDRLAARGETQVDALLVAEGHRAAQNASEEAARELGFLPPAPPPATSRPVYADDAWQARVRLDRWRLDAPAAPGPTPTEPAAVAELAELETRIVAATTTIPAGGSALAAARASEDAVLSLLAAPPPRTSAGRRRLAQAVGTLAEAAYEAWRDVGQRDPDMLSWDPDRLYFNPCRRCARWMAWANLERTGTPFAPLPTE